MYQVVIVDESAHIRFIDEIYESYDAARNIAEQCCNNYQMGYVLCINVIRKDGYTND